MDLAGLRISRGVRWKNIEKLLVDCQTAIDDKNVVAAEQCLARLVIKEGELYLVNKQIEETVTNDELEKEIDKHQAMVDEIIVCKIELNRLIKSAGTLTPTMGFARPSIAGKPTIKLPKLEIKKFDGSLSDWLRFWGQFESGIHNNTSLSTVDKFNYLRGLLSDSASLTIKGLQITDANYAAAISLLTDKYGRNEVLVSEHVRQLWNLKRVTKLDNGAELRRLFEEIMTHIASLKSLGKDVTSMGTLLCPIVLQSIPRFLVMEWNRKTQGKPTDDLEKLLEFVKFELEGAEQAWRISNPLEGSSKEGAKKSEFHPKKSYESSASTLVATESREAKSGTTDQDIPFCVFCDRKVHFSTGCKEYPNLEARREALRKNKHCFRCLRRNHVSSTCPGGVFCKNCNLAHHTLMCTKPSRRFGAPQPKTQKEERAQSLVAAAQHSSQRTFQEERSQTLNAPGNSNSKNQASSARNNEETSALIASAASKPQSGKVSVLQTMKVWIRAAGGQTIPVVMLLDGGSERSFLTQRVAEKLDLNASVEENVSVYAFGAKHKTQATRKIPLSIIGSNGVQIEISALQVADICTGIKLWECSQIEALLQSQGKKEASWKYVMGPGSLVSVDLLIGADFYWAIMTGHSKRIAPLLMATQSIFGWVLQGSVGTYQPVTHIVSMLAIVPQETTIDEKLARLWELDNNGVYATENQSKQSLQDVEVLQKFQESTIYANNRYYVNIPWANNKDQLSNNFGLAKERLRKLTNKLHRNKELFERYKAGIYEYLKDGHTEEVNPEEEEPDVVFYMPHHPIIREDRKTTKLRIVFDASSHEDNRLSLNQCQYTGPNLNPDIFKLLLRFRIHAVAISSDMQKAFLQIFLKEEDRNATRFLWTDEPWPKGGEPNLRIFRMTRVLFGMKSSPFLLAATIRLHTARNSSTHAAVGKIIDETTYVDDGLTGQDTVQQAFDFSIQAKELMQSAGMILTKWVTNSSELRSMWIKQGFNSSEEPVEVIKVLGLMWEPNEDIFKFKTTALFKAVAESPCTKRGLLEVVASLYDPLGFLAPKTIAAKCMLQDVWRMKLNWDDSISGRIKEDWIKWKEDLQYLPQIGVPRWYQTNQENLHRSQLHIFCDSSQRAYGVVAYLRAERHRDQVSVCIIAAKSKLAPLQLVSIPRLELMACLIATRLGRTIREALQQPELPIYFWSDSKVALQWIGSPPAKWKVFVARRVQEIQEMDQKCCWKYCNTKENIADIITRGRSLLNLYQNQEWWQGPSWLQKNQEEWPYAEVKLTSSEEEVTNLEETRNMIQVQVVSQEKAPWMNWSNYSSWNRIIRIIAWIKRFVSNCRKIEKVKLQYLSFAELQESETLLFKEMQQQDFSDDIWHLKKEKSVDSKSSLLRFQPFLDEQGLMRVGGRLQFAQLSEQKRHPFLLKGGGLTALFILHCHQKCLHGGIQATLQKIREKAWIIKGRQTVRKALKECRICKKWETQPTSVSEAPLPAARINEANSFEVTGLDFAGPVFVKEAAKESKAYICLFTCAVTRAIHLELVPNQGIRSFQLAFRRFIARRGNCKIIYSDNAATYQQSDKLLQEACKLTQGKEVQSQMAQSGIQWRFIAPRAAWWGGFYERMVGAVKRHLRRTLGAALLSSEELTTILSEVESAVNSRPLTTMTEDPQDFEYLTPAHFLTGRASGTLADMLPGILDAPTKSTMLRRWQYRKRLTNNFWKKWQEEYLLQLQTAHNIKSPNASCNLKVGDVVLIKEPKQPRGKWQIARIQELTPGRDKKIRSALLKTSKGKLLRRAIPHICPLEVI